MAGGDERKSLSDWNGVRRKLEGLEIEMGLKKKFPKGKNEKTHQI